MGTKKMNCPKCKSNDGQWKVGLTSAGSQRIKCGVCNKRYTPEKKKWAYSEEEKKIALRKLTDGGTGRAVGRDMNMSKSNAYRWAAEAAKKGAL